MIEAGVVESTAMPDSIFVGHYSFEMPDMPRDAGVTAAAMAILNPR
jgi:hypothetical protein